ncbi:MAG: peroxiredoxin [Betaproteobacteria bacterium]|nr:peroxiredoxin [Betaproteobacteria bacterium]
MKTQPVPAIELPSTSGQIFRSAEQGKPYVLYFYPKDGTPGCTTEGQDFARLYPEFQALGWAIHGVSRDSLKSHANFKTKLGLPFDLLSDGEESACQAFDVIKMKNLYGKQVRGIERSTFLVDEKGRVVQSWRGVKVPGHAQAVLDYIRTSTKSA